MKLREKQTVERRNRILDAAEELVRETGGTDFSVRRLAAVAEVAPATPFNLFLSKEGLLYALLSRNLEGIISQGLRFKGPDPSLHILEAATNAVDMFVCDPEFMRPLYRVLLGVSDPIHRPGFMARSLGYWRAAVLTIPDQALLSSEIDRELLATALQAQFLGLLEFWVHEEFDDSAFRNHVVYGICTTVLGLLDEANRANFVEMIRQSRSGLTGLEA